MNNTLKVISLAVVAVILTALYLFWDLGANWDYALPRRVIKIITIIVVGCAIAFSTVIFQTVTNNKILTPSILRARFDVYVDSNSSHFPSWFNTCTCFKQKSKLHYYISHHATICSAIVWIYVKTG